MLRVLLLLSILLINGSLYATTTFWKGIIDDRYIIYMELNIANNKVNGIYFYEHQRKEIILRGVMDGARLHLIEIVNQQETGSFSGEIVAGSQMIGSWQNPSNTKKLVWKQRAISAAVYDAALSEKGLYSISNVNFKKLVKGFEAKERPFRIKDYWEGDTISEKQAVKYMNYVEEDWSMFTVFYKGYVLFEEDYVGLITNIYDTPGAFGVHNNFIWLYRYTYDGKLIDAEEMGCYCYDSNMGSNDYYSTALELVVGTEAITIHSSDIHATLFEEDVKEGEKPFYKEKKAPTRFFNLKMVGED